MRYAPQIVAVWAVLVWGMVSAVGLGYSGGSGTAEDPYQIANKEDFLAMAANKGGYGECFILTADIDLTGKTFTRAVIARDSTIIVRDGFQGMMFTGVFDGNGHVIRHLTITASDRKSYVGLFGYIGNGGQVKNLGVEDVNISGFGHVGGLVGYNDNGTITSCHITGGVSGTDDYNYDYNCSAGGLVGTNFKGTIVSCYTTGTISGEICVGGLVGHNISGTLTSCYTTSMASSMRDVVGGLVGYNEEGIITSCNAMGVVSAQDSVGGLVGENSGTIANCYATGAFGGDYDIGGLVGENRGTITSCYATGAANNNGEYFTVGGLVGLNYGGTITTSYATGNVEGAVVGGLVGSNYNNSTITSCYAMGMVNGTSSTGGLVGVNGGTIMSSFAIGAVNSTGEYNSCTGGLMGSNLGTITSCYATGAVNGTGTYSSIGGLVGWNRGAITSSNATGAVSGTGEDSSVGGLVGNLNYSGTIMSGYATGVVRGTGKGYTVGGLVGRNEYGIITSCYATGKVCSIGENSKAGGIVGDVMGGTLQFCYATGLVCGSGEYATVGGLVGSGYGVITSSFWDIETTGQVISIGGEGKTTDQMQILSTFTNAGWNFFDTDDDPNEWRMPTTGSYPVLAWQQFILTVNANITVGGTVSGGGTFVVGSQQTISATANTGWVFAGWNDGNVSNTRTIIVPAGGAIYTAIFERPTARNPYKIATKEDLLVMAAHPGNYDKCFILTADIDLADETFSQAVIAPDIDNTDGIFRGTSFTGVFDGNGHVIRNLTIAASSQEYVGLFGYIGPGGQVKNLGLENVAVKGRIYIGGLVGCNYGIITSCCTTGTVNGEHSGGLVGYNFGNITSCYATDTVTGTFFVGGLVGFNWSGIITSCYATGLTSGDSAVGGLVGLNYMGTVTSCYATGVARGSHAIGGLVGINEEGSTIMTCCATGAVSGKDFIGGLVGYNFSVISSCYAMGMVKGIGQYSSVGGLVGVNDGGAVTSCYALGVVSGIENVGGLVGHNKINSTVTSCFWDTNTSGQATSDGGEGKTTAQMKAMGTFTDAGWDFSATDGDAADWKMPATEWYPLLSWQQSEDEFSITSMSVKAGRRTPGTPTDSFTITGTSFDIEPGAIGQVEAVEFAFYNEGEDEPCFADSISVASNKRRVTNGQFMATNTHYIFRVDVTKHTFSLTGNRVYLQGLGSSVRVEIMMGGVLLSGVAYDNGASGSGGEIDVINGKNPMPLELMMGVADRLRVDSAVVYPGRGTDTLMVKGIMAVADPNVNPALKEMTVTWGDFAIEIPTGQFIRLGNSKSFIYTPAKRAKIPTLPNAIIQMDWDTGRFSMTIRGAGLAAVPRPAAFNVRFAEYDESCEVN